MNILIIGAAGMIGSKLAALILADEQFCSSGLQLILADIVNPQIPQSLPPAVQVETCQTDIADPDSIQRLAAYKPDIVFHLAAVVSGEAESNFDKGYQSNLQASWQLLESFRAQNIKPRLIFASSLAVYGKPFPQVVPETYGLRPSSSYGTQKAMTELLISDYSRKGFVDGLSLRLPTVVIRPGSPNAAASSFLSSIIREPLADKSATLPVPKELKVWLSSPNRSVANLLHAARLSREELATTTTINLPGLTISVEQMINALAEVRGREVLELITDQPDPIIQSIVGSWPSAFETTTANNLGFVGDESFETMIAQYVTDHL